MVSDLEHAVTEYVPGARAAPPMPAGERLRKRLCELLEGPYRGPWDNEIIKSSRYPIHYDAVARVLAKFEGLGMPYRNYSEPVRQALKFGAPTRRILNLLIKAFKMSEEHASELRALHRETLTK